MAVLCRMFTIQHSAQIINDSLKIA